MHFVELPLNNQKDDSYETHPYLFYVGLLAVQEFKVNRAKNQGVQVRVLVYQQAAVPGKNNTK